MKGRALTLLLACAAALLVAVSASRAATSSVGVTEREFRISLGRLKVPHGAITFNVTNIGQDDHDVVIRRHGYSSRWFMGTLA